jgi:hypothetical protein
MACRMTAKVAKASMVEVDPEVALAESTAEVVVPE